MGEIALKKKSHKKEDAIPVISLIAVIVVGIFMMGIRFLPKNNLETNKQAGGTVGKINSESSKVNRKTDDKLQRAWKRALTNYDGNASIAVYSQKDNAVYSYTNNPNVKSYYTASTCKVAVLTLLLHQRNGNLTDEEKNLATSMIEESDNDATDSLVSDLGGSAQLDNLYHDLKMNHTKSDIHWGLTETVPSDQLKLLNNIFYPSDYLSDSSRKYIQSLMGNIDDSQDWGVSAGSNTFYLKNGWLQDDDGSWMINSIGFIPNPDSSNDYTIAVYTNENSSMEDGEDAIQSLASATKQILQ